MLKRVTRLISALPMFLVAYVFFAHFGNPITLLRKNPYYAFTGISSFLASVFHINLLLASFFCDVRGWWSWKFPAFSVKADALCFYTFDYVFTYLWIMQLLVELIIPTHHRVVDIEVTASIAGLYVLQTAMCVPMLYAAYYDWKDTLSAVAWRVVIGAPAPVLGDEDA